MVEIRIYTMPTCKLSAWIKTVLNNKRIKYSEKNFLEYKLKNKIISDMKAPLIEIGRHVIIGIDKEVLESPIIKRIKEFE